MNRVRFIYIVCVGVTLFIFGTFYFGFFAFPYPDLPPEEKAMYRLRESASTLSMSGGVVLILVSIVGGIIKAVGKRCATLSSMAFIGIAFLVLGCLYGSFVALPIPNPPPQGMQWVAHIFVSVTLLLAGLGLLLLVIVRKIAANKVLHRISRKE